MLAKLKTYFKQEDGATAIEYGLIAGLLSLLILAGLVIAGPALEQIFLDIGNALASA
jgi:pilus assembly protein Flp/PilA